MFITKQKSSRNQHMSVSHFKSNYRNIVAKLGEPDEVKTYKSGRLKEVEWKRTILGTRFSIRIDDFNYIHDLTKEQGLTNFNVHDFESIDKVDEIEVFLVGDARKANLVLPLLDHYFNNESIGEKARKIIQYVFEDYMAGDF